MDRLSQLVVQAGAHPLNVISTGFDSGFLSEALKQMGRDYKSKLKPYLDGRILEYQKVYIPILRGLRPLQSLNKSTDSAFDNAFDNYKARTIRDYFQTQKNDSLNIFTGMSLYEDAADLLLGKLEDRKKIKDFELFLSTTFFNGQPVSLTPNRKDDCLHITIGNQDRPIYDLGDGIQNLIVLLYPLFFNSDKPMLYLVEEPEMSLHPGLQRLFIDTILNEKFNLIQFFLTTHSNHFLDMVLDHSKISIYNFRNTAAENGNKYYVVNSNNEDINLLDSIGVRNSSVFLSNCTIWVEGICDRLYLNKYLDVYQKKDLGDRYDIERFKEDLHFSFVEYGGANIVHYSFDDDQNWEKIKASHISSKLLLIMDEDGTTEDSSSKKALRIAELKDHLKDKLIILPCREIENTLSATILKQTISILEKNDGLEFGTLDEKSYKDVYLGTYIEKSISGLRRKYAAESGTIANKVQFCKVAISQIGTIDDLSSSGVSLARSLWQFIKTNN